ncbi:hypothetical protein LX32DRAFT_200220 [Colletotrichum zoysiae]|uniref:Uncharacterized protein n=1 Tax=Colletotrichum zoysiae TaxID=1216348 RepID=A0AAD9HQA2_9PEZI|nr:hypothetical protein LX32DRAFT_200220 [Colletotrichum zoysiae]
MTERPALQLHELRALQKQHMQQMQDGPHGHEEGAASGEADKAPNHGGGGGGGGVDERGLRDFNYNGRVRNGERASERASSGVFAQHQPPRNSVSIYSTYSSYPPSPEGGGGHGQNGEGGVEEDRDFDGGGGGGDNSSRFGRGIPPPRPPRSPPPPLPHVDQPRRQPMMEVPPAPGTAGTVNTIGTEATAVAGTESVQRVRQPPPTYVPSQDQYSNRVRFVEDERGRRGSDEEENEEGEGRGNHSARPIDKARIKGGPNTCVLWVFACCAFFCYRCFMDEEF